MVDSQNKFIVGITHYNNLSCIEFLLKCISISSIKPLEVVIYDDCSLKNVELNDLRDKFPNLRLKLFISDVNFGGPAKGRNWILKYVSARKKNVFLFDADDACPCNFFENMLAEASQLSIGNNSPAVLSPQRVPVIDQVFTFSNFQNLSVVNSLLLNRRLLRFGINPFTLSGTLFIQPHMNSKFAFSENLYFRGVEDVELWLRIQNFLHLSKDNYIFYRISNNQISHNKFKHAVKILMLYLSQDFMLLIKLKFIIGYTLWHLIIKRLR